MSNLEQEIDKAFAAEAPEDEGTPSDDDQPEVEAAEADEPTAEEEAADAIRSFGGKLLAGKYKTPEELERAYKEVEAKLGEQGQELGQWRQIGAALQQQQQLQAQGPPRMSEEQLGAFDEWAMENPQQAAEYARQSGNAPLYERVIQNWAVDDPVAASRYERQLEMAAYHQQLQQHLQQMQAPLMQSHQQQEQHAAIMQVAQKYTDIAEYEAEMQEIAGMRPDLVAPIQNGTRDQAAAALESLYLAARGYRTLQSPPQAAQPTPAQQAAGNAGKRQAAVTTGHINPPTDGQPVDPVAQKVYDLFDLGVKELTLPDG